MINITENAKEQLFKVVSKEFGCRIKMNETGTLTLVMDKASSRDQVVHFKGKPILLVSKELAPLLENATLDLKISDDGSHSLSLNF